MKKLPKPQYSLFPNSNCQVCQITVSNNLICCENCAQKWLESIKLEGESVFVFKKQNK